MASIHQSLRSNGIGTLRESSLHAKLKEWYREPGDQLESPIDGYIIDIVRKDLLIEIQTQNFSALRKKLGKLIKNHKILLVYPIISDKWIIYKDNTHSKIIKRLSPKHSSYNNLFDELVYIPEIISSPNLSMKVILIQIEEIRQKNGKELWSRKGWSIRDKKLLKVIEWRTFHSPDDFLAQIPWDIEVPFTNYELAKKLKQTISLTRKMTYSLRKMGVLRVVGKKGNSFLHNFIN
ncbi:MAG: hypothetical protein ACFE8L_14635 [Candidatus Hodarchaeota archaeon]